MRRVLVLVVLASSLLLAASRSNAQTSSPGPSGGTGSAIQSRTEAPVSPLTPIAIRMPVRTIDAASPATTLFGRRTLAFLRTNPMLAVLLWRRGLL